MTLTEHWLPIFSQTQLTPAVQEVPLQVRQMAFTQLPQSFSFLQVPKICGFFHELCNPYQSKNYAYSCVSEQLTSASSLHSATVRTSLVSIYLLSKFYCHRGLKVYQEFMQEMGSVQAQRKTRKATALIACCFHSPYQQGGPQLQAKKVLSRVP